MVKTLKDKTLLVAGGRNIFVSELWIDHTLNLYYPSDAYPPKEIVSGGASGIDACGEMFAQSIGIPVKIFEADWKTHGKAAGPIRNKEMAEYADILLLIWNGKSRGSANMKHQMEKLNKPIHEVILRNL